MSDNTHYKKPQFCDHCGTELEQGWMEKGRPYYHCPTCDLYWTKKDLRIERKQRNIIAAFNAGESIKPPVEESDYTGTLFEGLS